MNGNSSKQVLLSVLGIAILVVAVVGVSFAFFSYTKTGTTNNTIQTGQIYTYLTEGTQIQLTNVLPKQTEPSSTITTSANDVGALTFSVSGVNQSASPITYKVYLTEGDAPLCPTGETDSQTGDPIMAACENRLNDSEVKILMSTTGGAVSQGLTTPKTIASLTGDLATGIEIAGSTFAANGSTTLTTHDYVLNMFISSDVKISDTDPTVNGQPTKYCAHATVLHPEQTTAAGNYGCELYYPQGSTTATKVPSTGLPSGGTYLPAWSDAYYSVKIRVVANTNATNTGFDYNGQAPTP